MRDSSRRSRLRRGPIHAAGERHSPSSAEQRIERQPGIADHRQCAALVGIVRRDIDLDERGLGFANKRPGAGGEILQPCADADDQVGLGRGGIGGAGAGHADAAERLRMIPRQAALAGLGFGDRNADCCGEAAQRSSHAPE